jgi:flagellar motility protein MotE (MotC chaperone)
MKIAIPILGLIALLGVAYGLAFFGIIPTQKMADHSPGLAHTLIALHLAKAKKPILTAAAKASPAASVVSPEQDALNTQKKQLADAQAALAKQQAEFEAQKQAASASSSAPPAASTLAAGTSAPVPDSAAKISAIYAAMSADDLVTIFSKLPDPDVITALMSLDEKKAGKVLAALPPTRAAHLTQEMSHPQPASHVVASL